MTQSKLGEIVGLSRTSITNIELGRQHVSLHHLFQFAEALNTTPDALLPIRTLDNDTDINLVELPPDTKPEVRAWISSITSKKAK